MYIVNDTAVNVSWQLYNALDITIDGYTVEYFLLSETCEGGLVRARTSPKSAGSQHFSSNDSENFDVIGGLTPGARYDFEVFPTATRDGIELRGEPASHEIIDLPGKTSKLI